MTDVYCSIAYNTSSVAVVDNDKIAQFVKMSYRHQSTIHLFNLDIQLLNSNTRLMVTTD